MRRCAAASATSPSHCRRTTSTRTGGTSGTSSTGSTRRAAAPPATTTSSRGRRAVAEFPPSPDEEDKDDENYHVITETTMEDVPPSVGDLPQEYQALVAGGYDEEALFQQALEASKADEDEVCPATARPSSSRAWWPTIWPRCHHHHSRRTRDHLPTTRGRRCRCHPDFFTASVAMTTHRGWSSTRRRSPSRRSSSTSSPTMTSSWRRRSCGRIIF
jgi:hypothetical protein